MQHEPLQEAELSLVLRRKVFLVKHFKELVSQVDRGWRNLLIDSNQRSDPVPCGNHEIVWVQMGHVVKCQFCGLLAGQLLAVAEIARHC